MGRGGDGGEGEIPEVPAEVPEPEPEQPLNPPISGNIFRVKTVEVLESIDGESLQNLLSWMEGAIKDLQGQAGDQPKIDTGDLVSKGDFDNLRKEFEATRDKQNETNNDLSGEIAKLKEINQKLEEEQADLKKKLDGHEGRIAALENSGGGDDLQAQIAKIDGKVDALGADLQPRVKELEARVPSLESTVQAASSSIAELAAGQKAINDILPTKADKKGLEDLNVRVVALEAMGPSTGDGDASSGLADMLKGLLAAKADQTDLDRVAADSANGLDGVNKRIDGLPVPERPKTPAAEAQGGGGGGGGADAALVESLRAQLEALEKRVADDLDPKVKELGDVKADKSLVDELMADLEKLKAASRDPPKIVMEGGDDNGLGDMVNRLAAGLAQSQEELDKLKDAFGKLDLDSLRAMIDELSAGHNKLKSYVEKTAADTKMRFEALQENVDTCNKECKRLEESKLDKGDAPEAGPDQSVDILHLKKGLEILARAHTIVGVGHGVGDAPPELPAMFGSVGEGLGLYGTSPPPSQMGMRRSSAGGPGLPDSAATSAAPSPTKGLAPAAPPAGADGASAEDAAGGGGGGGGGWETDGDGAAAAAGGGGGGAGANGGGEGGGDALEATLNPNAGRKPVPPPTPPTGGARGGGGGRASGGSAVSYGPGTAGGDGAAGEDGMAALYARSATLGLPALTNEKLVDLDWLKSLKELMERGGVREKADIERLMDFEDVIAEVSRRISELEDKVLGNTRAIKRLLKGGRAKAPARHPDPSGDHAMLSSKPLLGYKCMACDRPLDKLVEKVEHVPDHQLIPHLPIKSFIDGERVERELRSARDRTYASGSASETEEHRSARRHRTPSTARASAGGSPLRSPPYFPAVTPPAATATPSKPATAPVGASRSGGTPGNPLPGPHLMPGGYRPAPLSSRGRARRGGALRDENSLLSDLSGDDTAWPEGEGGAALVGGPGAEPDWERSFGGKARTRHARATRRAAHRAYGSTGSAALR